jgi:hypothetical protein
MEHEHLKQRASKLGLRGGDLAALAGMNAPSLSNFFRGRTTLDAMKRKELTQVLADLEKLRDYFPIPIGVHDAKQVAVMLERFRTGRFEEFLKLTSSGKWNEEPEGMNRKYKKVFASRAAKQTAKKEAEQ